MAEAHARLVGVEARLRAIEREGHMPSNDVVIKRIPAVRVAEDILDEAGRDEGRVDEGLVPHFDAVPQGDVVERFEAHAALGPVVVGAGDPHRLAGGSRCAPSLAPGRSIP